MIVLTPMLSPDYNPELAKPIADLHIAEGLEHNPVKASM